MTTRGDERYPQPAPRSETTMANPPQPLRPGVGDDDWLLRAAFAISLAALEDPETAYVLGGGEGLSIQLGDPTHWHASLPPRARRRGAGAVGRRAAAAAMLLALAIAPTTGL